MVNPLSARSVQFFQYLIRYFNSHRIVVALAIALLGVTQVASAQSSLSLTQTTGASEVNVPFSINWNTTGLGACYTTLTGSAATASCSTASNGTCAITPTAVGTVNISMTCYGSGTITKTLAHTVTAATTKIVLNTPVIGQTNTADNGVDLSAIVTVNASSVASVKFFANGSQIAVGVNSAGVWRAVWYGAVGSYSVTAIAYNSSGGLLSQTASTNITIVAAQGAVAASLLPVPITPPHVATNSNAGSLPGSLSVNDNGAATYNIPLVVPPGTAGMQPKLSLNYSSNSANSFVGLGWTLSGLSTIQRCVKTVAQDNAVGRVSFDTGDRLCLDGQRLIRANGPASGTEAANDAAYWAVGAEYRTEDEIFSRITRLGSSDTGGFKVESKDGRISYYGVDANSAIAAQGRTDGKPLAWNITSVEDRSSNYMTFKYTNDSVTGEYLIQQIRYGGNVNAALNPDLAIRFTYEAREDAKIQYYGGSRNDTRSRLTHVQTFIGTAGDGTGGALARDHTIHYVVSANSGRSLVDWMQVCAVHPTTGLSECLPKTTFEMGIRTNSNLTATGVPQFTLPANGINLTSRITGNFDGTGLTTFIIADAYNTGYETIIYQTGSIRTPDGVVKRITIPYYSNISVRQVIATDLNGDGFDDLVYTNPATAKWSYCINTSQGANSVSFNCPSVGYSGVVNIIDLKNDRKPHVVSTFNSLKNATDCSLVNGAMVCGTLHMNVSTQYPIFDLNMSPITLGRGGVTDFYGTWDFVLKARDPNNPFIAGTCNYIDENHSLQVSTTGCDRYRGMVACFSKLGDLNCNVIYEDYFQKQSVSPFTASATIAAVVGDFNSDGLTDFSYQRFASQYPTNGDYLCLSKETGVDCKSNYKVGAQGVSDWRGDGSAIALSLLMSEQKTCRYADLAPVCENFSSTFPLVYDMSASLVSMDASGVPQWLMPGVATQDPAMRTYNVATLAHDPSLDRLIRVINGFGNKEEVDYGRGNSTSLYARTAIVDGVAVKPVYPQMTTAPGAMVSHLRRDNGQGQWLSFSYSYEGAMYDATGRGSLGFTRTKVTDDQSGITKSTVFSQKYPFVGSPLRIQDVSRAGVLLQDTTNIFSQRNIIQTNGNFTIFTFEDSSQSVKKDSDGSNINVSSTLNEYLDNYGNLGRSTLTRSEIGSGSKFITQEVYGYKIDVANWLIGLQESFVATKTDPVAGSNIRTVTSTHNSIGQIDTQTIEPNDIQYKVFSTFEYANQFGSLTKQIMYWQDPYLGLTSRNATDVTYDNRGRFPLNRRNSAGQQISENFIFATGAKQSERDINGLLSTWTTDGYAQVETVLTPDGTENRTYRKKCSNDCPPNAVSALVSDQFNNGVLINVPKISYFDSANHLVQVRSWGFDGREIVADTRYDSFGRIFETDQPHFVGDPVFLAYRQSYDDLNRVVTSVTLDLGGVERASTTKYQGLVRIFTNSKLQQRTEVRNAIDQTVQVMDAKLGKTQFSYDPAGSFSTAIDPSGNVTTITYDKYGRKTDLRDPDLGWTHYTIDPLGRTVNQVSANQRAAGKSSSMRFDILDRLIERIDPDLESHWFFDTASNGIGQLAEAYTLTAGNKDYRRIHAYDSLGRPSLTTQILFDGSYTNLSQYDAWGRVIKSTYQRGTDPAKVFDSRFNSFGDLLQIQKGSLVLWKSNAQDASFRRVRSTLGNALIETNIFNEYSGRLSQGNVDTSTGISRLQELYLYDSIGNVAQRSQYWSGVGFTETLVYDELNRLKLSQIGQAAQTVDFTPAGNILRKSNVSASDYVYPPQGTGSVLPHAVSSISGIGSFSYDLDGNLLNGANRAITWNSYDMPVQITKQFAVGNSVSNFVYGPEHQRTRQVRNDGVTIIYAGSQEVETSASGTTVKTYWPAGLGVEIDRPAAVTELSWIHHDRLGSPISISDQNGNLREKLAYDAWGKRRSIDGSTSLDSLDGVVDNKGFTGHEMLDQLDLVHMNGRVYDPLTARFLSADPHVTDPTNGQNYNRYSYVLNNPTNLTDPTGFDKVQAEMPASGCTTDSGGVERCAGDGAALLGESGGKKNTKPTKIVTRVTEMDSASSGGSLRVSSTIIAGWYKEPGEYGYIPGAHEALPMDPKDAEALNFGINVILGAEGGIGLARAWPTLWPKLAGVFGKQSDALIDAGAAAGQEIKSGEFSMYNWNGYPAGVPRPGGTFRLLGGEEYQAARKAADAANKALRKDIHYVGKFDMHEIVPVKFNGSPTSVSNKLILDRAVHRQQVTPWWKALQKALETVPR